MVKKKLVIDFIISIMVIASLLVKVTAHGLGDFPSGFITISYIYSDAGAIVDEVIIPNYLEGVESITIPEKTENGIPVVGISDFAFFFCKDVKTIILPNSLNSKYMGDVAFLKAEDIKTFIESLAEKNNSTIAYIANIVDFMGKNNWTGTEEELKLAQDILDNICKKMDIRTELANKHAPTYIYGLYNALNSNEKYKYVREMKDNDKTKISEKSCLKFLMWVKAIPYNDMTIKCTDNTGIANYVESKNVLGLKYETIDKILLGDANGDSLLNVRDCAFIANAIANGNADSLPDTADYNKDGKKNVRDAAAISKDLASK